MVNEHLGSSTNEIYRDKVREIFEKLRDLVDEVGFLLLKIKVRHMNKYLKTKSIQTP